jgi:hypothetical protein
LLLSLTDNPNVTKLPKKRRLPGIAGVLA